MANHCNNCIAVSGEGKNVKRFHRWWRTHLLRNYHKLNSLSELNVFTPNERKNTDVYDLVGTRWIDTLNYLGGPLKEKLSFTCITAWAPCNQLLARLAEKFDVNITNEYEEPGMEVYGILTIENGIVTDDIYTWQEFLINTLSKEDILDRLYEDVEYLEVKDIIPLLPVISPIEFNKLKTVISKNDE